MAVKNIKEIRAAVLKNRGGLDSATDPEIMTVWRSLNKNTQQEYLKSIGKDKDDAPSTGTKSNV